MSVVNEGRDEIVKLIGAGLTGNEFDSVAVGSDNTTVTDSDTSLISTVDSATGLSASANGNTMSIVGTFTNNSASIRETSVYDSAGSVLLARQVIDVVNVESSDTLEVTFNINFSSA